MTLAKPYSVPLDLVPRPLSEIVPGLYQGRRPKTYVGYDLVVSCEEHLARKPMADYRGVTIHVPMRDEDDFEISRTAVDAASSAAFEVVSDGGKVLVHCTGGLNRSSVVTAYVLMGLGYSPRDAVGTIRERHDSYCLCNRAFERWVTGETLPTAETSAFALSLP